MNKRKAILFLFFIVVILAYSRFNRSGADAAGLPDAKDIHGDLLVSIPPVNDAIKSFQDRIKQNPKDGVSDTILGEPYLRQARETGDVSGFQRAELALNEAIRLLPNHAPVSAGLLTVDENGQSVLIVTSEEAIGSFNALGISIEPEGGSPQPTGDIVVLSNLQ